MSGESQVNKYPWISGFIVCALVSVCQAQCNPQPVVSETNGPKYASSDATINTDGSNGSYIPAQDETYGHRRRCEADYVNGKVDAFAWAREGQSTGIQFEARASKNYAFSTSCEQTTPGHQNSPPGDSWHHIHSDCFATYTVSGTGGLANRAASFSLVLTPPTGRSFSINYQLTDDATVSEEHNFQVDGSASLGVNDKIEVGLRKSARPAITARLSRAVSLGLSGSFAVDRTTRRTGNTAASDSDTIRYVDCDIQYPQCHGASIPASELFSINGSANVTAAGGSTIGSITIDIDASIKTTVQRMPYRQCKSKSIVTPPPVPHGGITPPAGSGGDTKGAGGGSTGSPSGGKGTDTKGSKTPPPGGSKGRGSSRMFGYIVPPRQGSLPDNLYFRVAPESSAKINFIGIATATGVSGENLGVVHSFYPTQALTLTQGQWEIEIPLEIGEVGVGYVEMSFNSTFPVQNTTRAAVECTLSTISLDHLPFGIQSGSIPTEPIEMSGIASRLWIDPLLLGGWSEVGPVTVSSFAVSGASAEFQWHTPPTVLFDEAADRWYLTMAPSEDINVEVVLSATSVSLPITVHFLDGFPVN